ncbi:MAG: LysR family transcriptional regulator [Acidimicrobiales bacterium]
MALPAGAPDLASLDLLVSVAEAGSLAEAGRRHHLSQPAVSMRLSALERRLGVTLLDRSPTGSRLTSAGVAVVEWAQPALEATTSLVAGVRALRGEAEGRLRVAASMTVAEYLLPDWLVALHDRAPGVAVALEVCNSAQALSLVADDRADLGFVEGLHVTPGLRSRQVGADELVVVVAPTHTWARRRRPVGLAGLAATPLVVREEGSGTRQVLESVLAPAGPLVPPAMVLGSTTAVKAAVVAGRAPAVVSRLAVGGELAGGRLVAVPVAGLDLRRPFRAVWRPGHPPRGPAHALLSLASRPTVPEGTGSRPSPADAAGRQPRTARR